MERIWAPVIICVSHSGAGAPLQVSEGIELKGFAWETFVNQVRLWCTQGFIQNVVRYLEKKIP